MQTMTERMQNLENEARVAAERHGAGYLVRHVHPKDHLGRLAIADLMRHCLNAQTDAGWALLVRICRLVVERYDGPLSPAEEQQIAEAYEAARKPDGGAEGAAAAMARESLVRAERWPWSSYG